MKVIFFLYSYVFACICHAAPLEKLIDEDPELTPGLFEGDIILDDSNRNGLRDPAVLWPNKTVFYKISDTFDEAHRSYIERAMRKIEVVSCIRFRSVGPSSEYYVNITDSTICNSQVGFLNKVQSLNLKIEPLGEGCFRIGAIIHHLLHTLGFHHMQNSHNRDEYIRIVEENIIEDQKDNFKKYNSSIVSNYGQGYDYGSIMHYDEYSASKNGEKTIIPWNPVPPGVMGQKLEMSEKDIKRLSIMYDCPERMNKPSHCT